jgi:hypothetical protein
MAAAVKNHSALNLYVDGATVALQPCDGTGQLDTVVVDPKQGTVQLLSKERLSMKPLQIFGVIGMYKLPSGSVMAVITGAQEVRACRQTPPPGPAAACSSSGSSTSTSTSSMIAALDPAPTSPGGAKLLPQLPVLQLPAVARWTATCAIPHLRHSPMPSAGGRHQRLPRVQGD